MKEIKITYYNGEAPMIGISEDGESLEFKKIDPYDRWKIIEKLEEAREKLIKIHQASW